MQDNERRNIGLAPSTTEVISRILNDHDTTPFIAGRYPSTYARDFFRSHARDFGVDETSISRGDAGHFIRAWAERTGESYRDVMIALADGYLAEWHVAATAEDRTAALAEYEASYPAAFTA